MTSPSPFRGCSRVGGATTVLNTSAAPHLDDPAKTEIVTTARVARTAMICCIGRKISGLNGNRVQARPAAAAQLADEVDVDVVGAAVDPEDRQIGKFCLKHRAKLTEPGG